MPILSIKNAEQLEAAEVETGGLLDGSEGEIAALTSNKGVGDIRLTNDEIERLKTFSTYYYATNDLILRLIQAPDDENPPPRFKIESIKATVLWKAREGRSPERKNYVKIAGAEDFDTSLTPTRIRRRDVFSVNSVSDDGRELYLELNEDVLGNLNTWFSVAGVRKPEFGFIGITFKSVYEGGREEKTTIWFKYSHNPPLTTPPAILEPPEPEEVVYTTAPSTFETLFIPTLSASFVYNFYEPEEENFEQAVRKKVQGFPLRDIPRYVQLSWTKAPILPPRFYENLDFLGSLLDAIGPVGLGEGSSESSEGDSGVGRDDIGTPPPPGSPPSIGEASEEARTRDSTREGMFLGGTYIPGTTAASKFFDSVVLSSGRSSEDASRTFDRPARGDTLLGESIEDIAGGGETVRDSLDEAGVTPEDVADIASEGVGDSATDGMRPPIADELRDAIAAAIAASGYIGYVILKERLDPETLEATPVDIFVIKNVNQTSFTDFKVAYGETYRYKIRSVFKFINKDGRELYADSDATFNRSGSAAVFDRGSLFSRAYYYDSEFSRPIETQTVEFQRPDPPVIQYISPNSRKKQIYITWNQKDQSRDVVGYSIYRRKAQDVNFERLNDIFLDKRDNFYIDDEVEIDQRYVYAVESIDVHGNISFLSDQYSAEITNYNRELSQRCEKPVKFVEYAGKTLSFRRDVDTKVKRFKKVLRVNVNPLFLNLDENFKYILKVKSLDTCEEKEIKLKIKTTIINNNEDRLTQLTERAREQIEEYDRERRNRILGASSRAGLLSEEGRSTFSELLDI